MPVIRTAPRPYRFTLGAGRLHHLATTAHTGRPALCGTRYGATVPRPLPGYQICAACLGAQHTRQS